MESSLKHERIVFVIGKKKTCDDRGLLEAMVQYTI